MTNQNEVQMIENGLLRLIAERDALRAFARDFLAAGVGAGVPVPGKAGYRTDAFGPLFDRARELIA